MTGNSNPQTGMQSAPRAGNGEIQDCSWAVHAMPFIQRPTCTIKEACRAAGLGRTKLYELIGGGALETTTIGRRRLVRVRSLLRLLKVDVD